MNKHRGRFTYGSSILALIAAAVAAFCPICVFSMFFGAISLGAGLITSSFLPVFVGFVVVFSIPFSWRGYQWLRKGKYAKFKVRSFTTLQLIIGTGLFLVGILSQNILLTVSGYITCLLIPILYKIRLKGHRSIALLLLFMLVSFSLIGRIVAYSLSPQNGCILCAPTEISSLDLASIEKLESYGFDDSILLTIDEILNSGKPAFLFFYSDWCHYCQVEKPIIESLKARYEGKIVFIFVNEKNNARAMQEFGVTAFPTMFLVVEKKGGEYLGFNIQGYTDEQELAKTLEK